MDIGKEIGDFLVDIREIWLCNFVVLGWRSLVVVLCDIWRRRCLCRLHWRGNVCHDCTSLLDQTLVLVRILNADDVAGILTAHEGRRASKTVQAHGHVLQGLGNTL